MLHDMKQK